MSKPRFVVLLLLLPTILVRIVSSAKASEEFAGPFILETQCRSVVVAWYSPEIDVSMYEMVLWMEYAIDTETQYYGYFSSREYTVVNGYTQWIVPIDVPLQYSDWQVNGRIATTDVEYPLADTSGLLCMITYLPAIKN